jgi:hypothetical protein
MWRHYNVVLENSNITKRPWQSFAISDNLNLLSAYVIWNILVLNIKGKVNKIAINTFTSYPKGKLYIWLFINNLADFPLWGVVPCSQEISSSFYNLGFPRSVTDK